MAGRPSPIRQHSRSGGAVARIDLSGPLFSGDARRKVDANIRRMLQGLAEEGERTVRAINAGHRRTGAFDAGVKGRVASNEGAPWWQHAVVSATHVYPWPQKRGGQRAEAEYRGGRLEARTRAFRKVAGQMRRAKSVLTADLAKGLD